MSEAIATPETPADLGDGGTSRWYARGFLPLFLASFLALYFELVVIRYLSTEIRVFAYLKNLALIASFFGIGLGMVSGASSQGPQAAFSLDCRGFFSFSSLCI